MLNSKGFDMWANGYDRTVGITDEDKEYPFAGYKVNLSEIYKRVLMSKSKKLGVCKGNCRKGNYLCISTASGREKSLSLFFWGYYSRFIS